jgi:hypothetical protein
VEEGVLIVEINEVVDVEEDGGVDVDEELVAAPLN